MGELHRRAELRLGQALLGERGRGEQLERGAEQDAVSEHGSLRDRGDGSRGAPSVPRIRGRVRTGHAEVVRGWLLAVSLRA